MLLSTSFVKIGAWINRTFLQTGMQKHVRVHRLAVWHFGSKERLGKACLLSLGIRHLQSCCILTFGWFHGVCILYDDVSEHSVPSSWAVYLHRLWIRNKVFRNVGIQNSDAGESPKSTNTTFRTRRKFEIRNLQSCLYIWWKQQAVAATASFAVGRTGDPTIHTVGYLHSKNSVTRLESSCSIKSHYAKHLTVCSIFCTTKRVEGDIQQPPTFQSGLHYANILQSVTKLHRIF